MVERKYVITQFNAPVIFDKSIMHSELNIPAKSAGFVRIWVDPETSITRASCYGESSTMGISANPEKDDPIIESFLNKG
jgi:hypothetical protein